MLRSSWCAVTMTDVRMRVKKSNATPFCSGRRTTSNYSEPLSHESLLWIPWPVDLYSPPRTLIKCACFWIKHYLNRQRVIFAPGYLSINHTLIRGPNRSRSITGSHWVGTHFPMSTKRLFFFHPPSLLLNICIIVVHSFVVAFQKEYSVFFQLLSLVHKWEIRARLKEPEQKRNRNTESELSIKIRFLCNTAR